MTSLTPDITESLPMLLSARTTSAESQQSGVLYDVVISGIGFVLAVDSQNPYVRESIAVQKQQIDTSTEAGEQTLEGNWIRSQTSWHHGAGADYYEPGARDETTPSQYRFKDSRGVNPWTQGQLSLHPSMVASDSTAGDIAVCGGRRSGADVWYSYYGTSVYRHDSGGTTTHATGVSASDPANGIVNAGSVLLTGGTTGVQSITVSGGSVASLLTRAAGADCVPYFAKGRIITTTGAELHQHALAGGAIDATSLVFTHGDSGWTWSGVTETPDAILAAGYSNGMSAIFAFVLTEDAAGSVPTLSQPFQVAEMPPGEEIRSIKSYLGLYLGIGTTAGVRVGVIGANGQVQYGPLLLETADPVVALEARDSYIYAATGNSVIRVNVADPIGDGLRFPYAYDVEVTDGVTITGLALYGVSDRVVAAANGTGTFVASDTDYVDTGWLESGDIRYGTTAPKAFRTMDVSSSTGSTASVAVSVVVDGSEQTLVSLSNGLSGDGISLAALPVPLSRLSYKLTLAATSTTSPTVAAVAVKAVPVPRRQRLIQYPVLIPDKGRDAKGVAFGYEGYATILLAALEELEDSQTIATVQDKTRPEQFEATIEKVEFARVEPRSRSGRNNFGGVAKVTVKTL